MNTHDLAALDGVPAAADSGDPDRVARLIGEVCAPGMIASSSLKPRRRHRRHQGTYLGAEPAGKKTMKDEVFIVRPDGEGRIA